MLDSSTHLLKTARSLVINPKDPPTWSVLAGHSRTVSDSIKSLITAIRLDNNDSVRLAKDKLQQECLCKGLRNTLTFWVIGTFTLLLMVRWGDQYCSCLLDKYEVGVIICSDLGLKMGKQLGQQNLNKNKIISWFGRDCETLSTQEDSKSPV